MEDFDYTTLFDNNDSIIENVINENDNPNKDAIEYTKELLLQAKKQLNEYSNKTFKRSNKKVFVGTEMEGQSVSVNKINSKRIQSVISNAKQDILRLENELILLENSNKKEILYKGKN